MADEDQGADEDYGARIRAAQAYSGMDREKLADESGIKVRTLDRLLSNERAPSVPEAKRIAQVCSVPIGFLVEGWNVARPIQDRLTDIEQRLTEVAARDGELTTHERELLTRFEELIQRLGRDIGRGRPQSRGARRLPPAAGQPGS